MLEDITSTTTLKAKINVYFDILKMSFAGWEARMKSCDCGLGNAMPRGRRSRPRSQFFTIQNESQPANNLFTFPCFKLLYKPVNMFIWFFLSATHTSR